MAGELLRAVRDVKRERQEGKTMKSDYDPKWRSWKFLGVEILRVRAIIRWWPGPSWHVHFGKFRKLWAPASIRIGPVKFSVRSWRPCLPVGTITYKVTLNEEGEARITFL